jgi:hypothetical protein
MFLELLDHIEPVVFVAATNGLSMVNGVEDAGLLVGWRPSCSHGHKWPGAHLAIRAGAQARPVRLPAGRPPIPTVSSGRRARRIAAT